MSAGAFSLTKYQGDNGIIYPIRVQPESVVLATTGAGGATNAAPTAAQAVNVPLARVSKSRRAYGIGARIVRFRFTGTPPTGYLANSVLTLAALTPAFYNSVSVGVPGTYLGATVQFIGKSAESFR